MLTFKTAILFALLLQAAAPAAGSITVWEDDPIVPMLNYHRFIPDGVSISTGMKRRLDDFDRDLQRLYDAGYTLISLDDFTGGNIRVPAGRRPMLLSFDDAYFADQIWLDPETEEPTQTCAIGRLWKFYQSHPDFGFAVAMFANFGDKFYGNVYREGWWYVEDGWETALAEAIAWGIEHEVMPYNHLFIHPKLDITEYADIWPQAQMNDMALRDLLSGIGKSDLIARVNNYIALPYGIWPINQGGIDHLLAYTDPEGRAVRAVFEAGFEYMPAYSPAPWHVDFDAYRIPRLAGMGVSIDALVRDAWRFPSASECELSLNPESLISVRAGDVLPSAVKAAACPSGVYIIGSRQMQVERDSIWAKLNWISAGG